MLIRQISQFTNTFVQVMLPSGARVEIQRASWGLDVAVYTPRAKVPANEPGLCIFPVSVKDHNAYGESLRYSIQY